MLPYGQPLAVEPLGGDDLTSTDRDTDMAIATRAPVKNDRAWWRAGIGVDSALAKLPLVVGSRARKLPTSTEGDLYEAFAVPTPVATELVAPGGVGRVLLRNNPVDGSLFTGCDGWRGRSGLVQASLVDWIPQN